VADLIKKGKESPYFNDRTGEKHTTKQGYEIEIIEYNKWDDCTIKFNDDRTTVLYKVRYEYIKKGTVQNPYCRTIYNVGYFGEGMHKSSTPTEKITKVYDTWRGMIRRCYNEKERSKQPSYANVSVCEEWHNFQVFAEWFEQNYNSKIMQGWHLDKDILIKGNKIYSPETCCFVPVQVNNLFVKNNKNRGNCPVGVYYNKKHKVYNINYCEDIEISKSYKSKIEAFGAYKYIKENRIKRVAEEWRGKITEQVYQSLINYKVEITD
jgi:hypothetical protein